MMFSSATDFGLLKAAIKSRGGWGAGGEGRGKQIAGLPLGALLAAQFWGFMRGEIS